ncbi:MAG: ThiF family adenylyltransferase, partial [Acidimicrobiales bacterium]
PVLAVRRAGAGPVVPVDLDVLVGTPSRRLDDGALRQHLVCWRFDDFGRHQAQNLIFADADDPDLARRGAEAQQWIPQWVAQAEASWVQVMEARAEVTIRRDEKSSAQWIRGKRVVVMGCGALGGPIAEFCVRGGAAVVQVVDNDLVSPGVLVRQPYSDADIGIPKSLALASRLNRLRTDSPVQPAVGSAQAVVLTEGAPPPDVDLVIDATADGAVAALLELRRSRGRATWPPCISVGIGHDARRGVVTISKRGATGAGRDVLRRLALAARGHLSAKLEDVGADFFPIEPRGPMFQPEPGCSTPTFTGSCAELAALAGHLFDAALGALADSGPPEAAQPMAAAVVRLECAAAGEMLPGVTWMGWPNDLLCDDPAGGYEIRISQPALTQMRTEARRGARLRGPEIETGGLMLGQVDDACQCVWVDESSGPPPDSRLAATHFDHGIEGVERLIAHHRRRSHNLMTFLGMWHIHPYGVAAPSRTDKLAMRAMVLPVVNGPRRALILILGGDQATWLGWVDGDGMPDAYAEFVTRPSDGTLQAAGPPVPRHERSGDFAGGWGSQAASAARRSRRRFPLNLRLRRRRVDK